MQWAIKITIASISFSVTRKYWMHMQAPIEKYNFINKSKQNNNTSSGLVLIWIVFRFVVGWKKNIKHNQSKCHFCVNQQDHVLYCLHTDMSEQTVCARVCVCY